AGSNSPLTSANLDQPGPVSLHHSLHKIANLVNRQSSIKKRLYLSHCAVPVFRMMPFEDMGHSSPIQLKTAASKGHSSALKSTQSVYDSFGRRSADSASPHTVQSPGVGQSHRPEQAKAIHSENDCGDTDFSRFTPCTDGSVFKLEIWWSRLVFALPDKS